MSTAPNPAQARFNETYITATEIATEMQVSRPAVLRAKRIGLLPEPIAVGASEHVCIWERATALPAMEKWRAQRAKAPKKDQEE
jgi:hypothetical protein